MQQSDFRLPAADGAAIFVRSYLPEQPPRAIVQVSHGMAEHSERYGRFAQALNEHGYGMYANDHRGHGYTASTRAELGHFADRNGWGKVVSDQVALLREIKSRHPHTPLFLMGHSMGSYIARSTALRVARELAGLILSGTSHDVPLVTRGAHLIARAERARVGAHNPSPVLRMLTFDAFNKKIPSPRTECDWLSRDEAEVDKYRADPLCGFTCSTQLFCDMFSGMREVFSSERIARLPKHLPVYILAGECDPLNDRLAAIKRLHQALEAAKLTDVTLRIYQDARHELLNETNREEVTRDLIGWLDERMAQLC